MGTSEIKITLGVLTLILGVFAVSDVKSLREKAAPYEAWYRRLTALGWLKIVAVCATFSFLVWNEMNSITAGRLAAERETHLRDEAAAKEKKLRDDLAALQERLSILQTETRLENFDLDAPPSYAIMSFGLKSPIDDADPFEGLFPHFGVEGAIGSIHFELTSAFSYQLRFEGLADRLRVVKLDREGEDTCEMWQDIRQNIPNPPDNPMLLPCNIHDEEGNPLPGLIWNSIISDQRNTGIILETKKSVRSLIAIIGAISDRETSNSFGRLEFDNTLFDNEQNSMILDFLAEGKGHFKFYISIKGTTEDNSQNYWENCRSYVSIPLSFRPEETQIETRSAATIVADGPLEINACEEDPS